MYYKDTVRDITKRAMMNRSTFYRHYLDKYDLLEAYMDEMYALFEDREGEHQPHEAPSSLIDLLKHIHQFADFYRAMFGTINEPFFDQRLGQKAEANQHQRLAQLIRENLTKN